MNTAGERPGITGNRRLLIPKARQLAAALTDNGQSNHAQAGQVNVGDGIAFEDRRWSFGGETSRYFDRHIKKSVPGYADGHALIAEFSDFFVPAGGKIIEVGCSVGSLAYMLAKRHAGSGAHVLGVDSEPNMIVQARATCASLSNLDLRTEDAREVDYTDADLVVMYYVMQFIPVGARRSLIDDIRRGMRPGGAFIVFDKTRFEDTELQDISGQVYDGYKLSHGFRPDEIIAKSQSLRGVLTPLTSTENKAMLTSAGFKSPETIYRYLAFEGVVAIRPVSDQSD